MWTILIGLVPFHAAFWLLPLTAGMRDVWGIGMTFDLVAVESCAFMGRVLWLGPGKAKIRVPSILLCAGAAALLPGWLAMLTGERYAGTAYVPEFAIEYLGMTFAAAAAAAVLFALGSRDVPENGTRTAIGRTDRFAIMGVGALFAFAAIPLAMGTVTRDSWELRSLPHDVGSDASRRALIVVMDVLSSQNWRWGIRGIDRLRSRSFVVFGVLALLWTSLVGSWTLLAVLHDGPPCVIWAPAIAFFAVPIGREFFLRFAGYRAINVYAERRRA